MTVPKMSAEMQLLLGTLLLLDKVMTFYAITRLDLREYNPMLKGLIGYVGIAPALFMAAVVSLIGWAILVRNHEKPGARGMAWGLLFLTIGGIAYNTFVIMGAS